METITVPKFRSCKRLVQWMERNWHKFINAGVQARLSPERERVFLTTKKEQPNDVAACVASYAHYVGRLPEEIENLLRGHGDSLCNYIRIVRGKDQEVPQDLFDSLAGDSRNLYRIAKDCGRLPKHLEDTIADPRYAFMYAKEVLRGRLPRNIEDVFFKDAYFAAKYAFEVIRGFAPVKLPEELHAFMIMKSFEQPDNEYIRTYMEASESDPDRVGNTDNKVR
jgi:hypothetical protein